MAADVIYVYLYLVRGLQLTAILYVIFLGLCVGWRWWAGAPRKTADGGRGDLLD